MISSAGNFNKKLGGFVTLAKHFIRIIFVVISVVVIINLFRKYDLSVLKTVTVDNIILILSATSFTYLLWVVFYMKYLFKSFHMELSFKKTMAIFVVTYLVGGLRGAFLGPLGVIYLRTKILSINYQESVFISIAEAFIRYVTLILLSIAGVVIIFNLGGKILPLLFFGLAGLFISLRVMNSKVLSGIYVNTESYKTLVTYWAGLCQKLSSLDVKGLSTAVSWFLVIAFLNAAIFSRLLYLCNYRCNIFVICCIRAMSMLIGVLSLIPFGLGPQDLTELGLLMKIGVDKNSALSCILLDRIFFTVIPITVLIILGNFYLWNFISPPTRRKPAEKP